MTFSPFTATSPAATARSLAGRTLLGGALASAASAAVLVWRGRRDAASASAPVNAVSHWLWPRAALRQDAPSWRYTGTGALVHTASSLLWSALYVLVRRSRTHPTPINALSDAAAVTALASWVDLQAVPDRLSPGFEKRLAPTSTAWVYVAFAAGLAVAGLATARRR